MNTMRQTAGQTARKGIAFVELVMACAVLVTIMGIATSICFQVSQVWKDVRHHRVATAELSNQMEQLIRMSAAEAKQALTQLSPSALSRSTLLDPKLEGELVPSELGTQINLQLDWKRRQPGQPVKLSGWILDEEAKE